MAVSRAATDAMGNATGSSLLLPPLILHKFAVPLVHVVLVLAPLRAERDGRLQGELQIHIGVAGHVREEGVDEVSTPHRQSACTGGGGKEGGRKREGEKERKSTEGEGTLAECKELWEIIFVVFKHFEKDEGGRICELRPVFSLQCFNRTTLRSQGLMHPLAH